MIGMQGKAALAVFAIIGLLAYNSYSVRHAYSKGHADAVSERAAQDLGAMVARTVDNAALAAQQDQINIKITKAANEELAPVVARIATDRVRVGPALCGGPAAPTQAESAGSGDGDHPAGRLVRDDLERDLDALKLRVEEALATGRACQAFVRENGLAP
jgi:hypothetical protein